MPRGFAPEPKAASDDWNLAVAPQAIRRAFKGSAMVREKARAPPGGLSNLVEMSEPLVERCIVSYYAVLDERRNRFISVLRASGGLVCAGKMRLAAVEVIVRIGILVVSSALLGACAQTSSPLEQGPSASANGATARTAQSGPGKVCRREQATGSVIGVRVCRTSAEWTAIDAANARNAEQFRGENSRPAAAGSGPGGR
jgi:hypothetical protein